MSAFKHVVMCTLCLGAMSALCAAAPKQNGNQNDNNNESGNSNQIAVVQIEDDSGKTREFVVKFEDGALMVKVDGETVDPNQIEIEGDTVYRSKDDGSREELFSLKRFAGDMNPEFDFEVEMEELPFDVSSFGSFAPGAEHPPVMMGIQLDVPSEALAYHLGIDRDKTTMVAAVYKDLPASDAGLNVHDIIVRIDGSEDAGPDALRKTLAESEAGDELEIEIIHKGKRQTVTVDLVAYDAEKLGRAMLHVPGGGRNWAQLREIMPDLEGRLRGFALDDEQLRELFIAPGGQGDFRVFRTPRPPRPPRPPQPFNGLDAEELHDMLTKRLEGHQDSTERLADRLNAIEEKVDRLMERLEEMLSRFNGND